MDVGVQLHYLLPLYVGEHHEGVHRPLDVVWGVLFGLKNGKLSIIWDIIIGQEHANFDIRNNYLSWLGAQETKYMLGARNFHRQTKCSFGFSLAKMLK